MVDIAIEHIADDYNPPAAPTGVEPRGNFIYENPVIVSAMAGALADFKAERMLLFPTGTPLGVLTDAGMFARAGYPVASLISARYGSLTPLTRSNGWPWRNWPRSRPCTSTLSAGWNGYQFRCCALT